MSDPLANLLGALILTDTHARTNEDIFTGTSEWMPTGRVFGGQVLGQSLMATQLTIPADRVVHSMHGYFLRPGNIALPITFSVDRIHDGRSFSTRRCQAYQEGLPIFSMIASFQTEDGGLDHQVEMPTDLPQPEDLPTAMERVGNDGNPLGQLFKQRAFDIRHVQEPVFLAVEGPRVAHQAVWLKTIGGLPDDPNIHRAAMAYSSDYALLEPILRRHGVPWGTEGLKVASLDHAMWFHRFGRMDEWVLYTQESPTATGGRGLSTGRLFRRDGVLLASVAQEGTIRVPRG
jgi:acyl-CoA thioesterase-2